MTSPRTANTNRRRDVVVPRAISSEERAQVLAVRLAEWLARAWQGGERLRAEDVIGARGFLADYPEAAWLVIHEEIRQRRELGPPPIFDEFLKRFPRWEKQIHREFAGLVPQAPGQPRLPECGDTLAGCRIVAKLGSGVEGHVFLAVQEDLAGRPIVLKLTPCSGREHLSLARLLHSHIVPLYFVQDFPDRDIRVLAMPYLGGASLDQVLDELSTVPVERRTGADLLRALDRLQSDAPLPASADGPVRAFWARSSYPVAICWLGTCLAEAMHYAHERGLVHLDLKPGNVLLAGDGQPLLLDFHLARAPVVPGTDCPDWFGGTPGFMAPEQRQAFDSVREGQPIPAGVDARSDLYSLGMVLYVALGGEPPATGKRARPLRHWNPAVSRGLSDILGKCVEANPAYRYPDAASLAKDLRRHLTNRPLRGVVNWSLVERWQKWRRRRQQGLGVGVLMGALFATLAALGIVAGTLLVGRYWEGRESLQEGRACLLQGRPVEAERLLSRGLERTAGVPGTAALARELVEEREKARIELFQRDLHAAADQLRFLGNPDSYSVEAADKIADSCERLWDRCSAHYSVAVASDQVRTDLLDLAVLGTRWRIRSTPLEKKNSARQRALGILDKVERQAGPSPALARERALYLSALGDRDGARAALSEAAALPPSAWDQYALGRSLLDEEERDAAATALAAAVQKDPGAFWPNFYQGICAYRRGHYAEAVEAFRACIALAPTAAPCYCNRGQALAALGRNAEARLDYDRCLVLDPKLVTARLARAALELKQGHSDAAEADLRQALDEGADPGIVYYNLALVEVARQNLTAARAALRSCLSHRPDHAAARALLVQLGPGY